jgi:hypothetical protein
MTKREIKHGRGIATDDEIRKKALTVIWSYPTQGAAWTHITGTTYAFLKDVNLTATPEDIERVVKGLNLRRKMINGEERFFAPEGMSREELTRLLYSP